MENGAGAAPTGPQKPEHPVRKYFNYDSVLDESRCVIATCQRKKVPGNHLGNLEKHLRRKHKDKIPSLESDLSEWNGRRKKKPSKKTRLLHVAMSARKLKLACVRLIAVHGRPIEMMNDPAFQDIVRPMIDAMPARERFAINDYSVRNMIKDSAKELRNFIKNEIKGKVVSLKVDSTTKNGEPYFGVNIQFSKDGTTQLRTLAVKRLFLSQTAENLKNEIMTILREYDIEVSSLVSFTCDNGANMLRAADLLKEEQVEAQDLCDEIQMDLDLELRDDEDDSLKLSSVKCAAHTLQLAVMDDSLKKSPVEVELLKKARDAVKLLRTETYRKRLKREFLAVPVLDNATRWNTSYAMLASLQRIENFLETEEIISKEDWSNMQHLMKSLEPAMIATKALQSEQLTLGDMFGIWLECKAKLKKVNSPLSLKIVENMELRERRQVYAPRSALAGQEKVPALFEYPGFEAAILLDPRYFSCLDDSEVVSAKAFIRKLWKTVEKKRNPQLEIEEEAEPHEENNDSDDEIEAMLRAKDLERSATASVSRVNISTQLEVYYRETARVKDRKTSILNWWEKHRLAYPELYLIACVLHAIPATQVSVERLFSALRFIMHYLRSGLSSDMIEDLVLIHSNSNLMKEDVLSLIESVASDDDDEFEEMDMSTSTSNSGSA
ncbi:zinc finger BED domain-containing protein DAYSLEEPER-like [Thrips palmi]|uniref:Zinc finger BED domain-containing protein DAYSLEEPER-like n=1 Tax=Thrips palmi TaxID=161013 RepID=A0A6P8YK87_THRPL|nr:zinc finger BED domain-containing protein DAYSLEEPER-like [Thrips palmi]